MFRRTARHSFLDWVGIAAAQSHDGSFVVEALKNAIDEGAEFQRDNVDLHAQLRKSSCIRVAIFMRCVLEELVMMENSTGWPDGSIS